MYGSGNLILLHHTLCEATISVGSKSKMSFICERLSLYQYMQYKGLVTDKMTILDKIMWF